MSSPTCSLSILVARTDLPFMMHTIPHLVKMCNFPFLKRVLCVDTAPLSGEKRNRPGIGTMEQLRQCCDQLLQADVVDTIIDIDYSESYRQTVYRKHLGSPYIRLTHNYKGYPILGTIFSLEAVPGDYVLHFDSDMMLYQAPNHNWIADGIKLLETQPQVLFVRPLAGPPTADTPNPTDPLAHATMKHFGSRAYLLQRQRFEQFLPLPILWRPYRNRIFDYLPNSAKTALNYLTGKGRLGSWEIMVTNQLAATDYVRANLTSPQAWTLHPIARGPAFIQALPNILRRVESGWYPPQQAGIYDLDEQLWLEALANQV